MIKFLHKIGNLWWCFWSNIRWRKSNRFYDEILPEDLTIHSIDTMRKVVNRIYAKFKYTADGADQLWDCITPPPANYEHYVNGELKDDCDGWASVMNYVLHKNNIEAYILSAEEIGDGHCICLFKLNDLWHINDYNSIHKGFKSVTECIEDYNKIYEESYKPKTPVYYNGIIKYDYQKGKFKLINIKRLEN